nr:MAG TPA: hypothetical protein [Caudoviricetes sp.]DAU06433.1 MAG TPA: hypothetical protein [Caudoviricetes sp.]
MNGIKSVWLLYTSLFIFLLLGIQPKSIANLCNFLEYTNNL